ncbi:MAG: L,D-transpeptidase [Anaerolineae bacterium]|nr:L,D-transpeptidase [Anaerolineae bacterium]
MKQRYRWLLLTIGLIILMSLSLLVTLAQDTTAASVFATNTPMLAESAGLPLAANVTPAPSDNAQTAPSTPIQVFEPEACRYVAGQATTAACRTIIEANPEPNVTDIQLDSATLDQYSFWRVGPQAVTTYDAPNGNAVGQIPAGFNFVNIVSQADGWLQSEDGTWLNIETSSAYFVSPSLFTGVRLPQGWNQPFGWILDTTGIYASTYPGGPSTSESGLVPLRYERYNIFAEAEDNEGWTWYMVGPDQWVKQVFMTVIKPIARPDGARGRWVAVDLFEQSLVAYEDDMPVFATLMSSGLPRFTTDEGLFEVWARLERDGMTGATGAPEAYALQSVPWVQYFDGSNALHGTYWHDLFGYRRSRGCVNLSISDAGWVFKWMAQADANENGEISNYVYVHSSGEYRRG